MYKPTKKMIILRIVCAVFLIAVFGGIAYYNWVLYNGGTWYF